MTNNLRKIKQDLCAYIKRCKDVHYSDSLLITFLMSGMIFAKNNLFAAPADPVEAQKTEITNSIHSIRQQFRQARSENNKLLKATNLELTKLMEQGDHVIKSPWSSWQFGINYFNNNWNGTYKGRGDKKEKYPYEGVFQRSLDVYERSVSPDSDRYSLLSRSASPYSASSNARQGIPSGYGIASTKKVTEPIVGFEVNAGIRPKTVNKSPITIAAKTANVPVLPGTIGFVPPVVNLPTIIPSTPSTPTITAPPTGNGVEKYIRSSAGTELAGSGNSQVGAIAVNTINNKNNINGIIDVNVTNTQTTAYGSPNHAIDVTTKNVTFSATGASVFTYDTDITQTGYSALAFAKLVEGSNVNINNVTINFNGEGRKDGSDYRYNNWLFHTDGHNNIHGGGAGDSNWIVGSETKINISGKGLAMWTSQRHNWSANTYIGFINSGNIAISGSNNIGWIALDEYGAHKQQYFWNKSGNITVSGNNNTLAYIMARTPSNTQGGWHFINDGDITLSGTNQNGIVVGITYDDYKESSIMLNKPIKITGTGSVGIYLPKYMNLAGGDTFTTSSSGNKQLALGTEDSVTKKTTTKESVIKLNLSGSNNVGAYFNYNGATGFELKDYTLEADGTNDTLVYIKDGKVTLSDKNSKNNVNKININGGTKNVGIYTISPKNLDTSATMTLTGATESIGLYAKGTGASNSITNKGKITGTGLTKSIGIVAEGSSKVTNKSEVDVEGTGVVGLVAKGSGATIDADPTSKVKATGSSSAAAYTEAGAINFEGGSIDAQGGAIDLYANKGTIKVSENGVTTAINTGQKSLAFMTNDTGKIRFENATTATIQGGSDAPTRGTAFYYTPSGLSVTPGTASTYGSFSKLGTDLATAFDNTLGNLTLDMKAGSRLMIASNINASLTNTTEASIKAALPGLNLVGSTDYKTAMLYLSYLNVDKAVNLDDANDDYNKLEISNSSVENNNTMSGTQAGQVAMAQENIYSPFDINWVTLTNNGTINLSGANSTGMYAKSGVITNKSNITVGDSGTGIYGIDNSKISNTGTITIGSNSTGLYYDDARNSTVTTTGMTNNGTIKSAGNNSVGMSYNHIGPNVTTFENAGTIELTGDKNTGMYATGNPGYNTVNSGTIKMGNSASLNNPNVALYTSDTTNATRLVNKGTIEAGNYTIGIFGNQSENSGNITVGDGAIGVYAQKGNVDLTGGKIKLGGKEAVGVYTVGGGQTITNSGTDFDIADTSYGFVNLNTSGTGNTIISTKPNLTLGNDVVYIYSNDTAGTVTNSSNVTSTGSKDYVIYSAGTVNNSGNLNLTSGTGNVGIYSIKGGTATNTGTISIGGSDVTNNAYSIGMAAGYGTTDTGNIINNGTINVNGESGIGMFASGSGSTVTNNSTIMLNANKTTGIYADNGATAINSGTIKTGSGPYSDVVGVYLGQGSKLINNKGATIDINSSNGIGVYLKGGTVANYGTLKVNGETDDDKTTYTFTTPPTGKEIGGVSIDAPAGATSATITVNGVPQTPVVVNTIAENPISVSASSIGLYVNTSGKDYTRSIDGLGKITSEADLIIGTEAAESTNSKYILVNDPKIITPYKTAMLANRNVKWNIYSGSLTWTATATLDQSDGSITKLYMARIPYTNWAGKKSTPVNSTDTYNFTDGLEQRYGVETLGTRERQVFTKLNSIGNNEEVLLYQAFDEMMGHQYGNTQHRIYETGNLLDKEFTYLRKDWRTPSKQNNKIKTFGIRNEYNSDTAGIIDYRSNAYGVAYVHEDEKIKMGNSSGWYAGVVTNRFKFKDIGKSKEDQTILKAGIFKTMSPASDHNGALQWTIGGDVFAGINQMKRRYLVVDQVFQAKSTYNSYGAAFKTDLGYDLRLSERTHLRPYGALKMEYGRFNDIKESSGEVRLEVNGNDYFSFKPEVGVEFKYVQPLAVRTNLSVGLTAAYENELGKIENVKNQGRVRYTNADWFGIRGEKEDRRGNGKFDLNIGIDNTRFGVTVNGGYDTKGNNVRAGIGFRAIY